jgi:hypothetical protein
LAWNGTTFVATVGSGVVYTSPDCVTWTPRTVTGAGTIFRDVTWSTTLSLFLMSTSSAEIVTSPDGITWSVRVAPISVGPLACNSTVCVGLGNATSTYSTDAVTWNSGSVVVGNYASNNVCGSGAAPTRMQWTGTQFVAVRVQGANGGVVSSDGITWTGITLPNATTYCGLEFRP